MKRDIPFSNKTYQSKQGGAVVNRNSLLISVLSILIVSCIPALAQNIRPTTAEKPQAKVKLSHPEVPRMPAKELVQLLKKKADVFIVDTQSADGYEMWHIPSAINITYDAVADPTNRQLLMMGLPMDKTIVIYCLCEEGTDSAKMALEFRQLGYRSENVKVLEGGLVLWDEKGYPMVKQKVAD
jgi:rhodanese-related sulfurtransferase